MGAGRQQEMRNKYTAGMMKPRSQESPSVDRLTAPDTVSLGER